MKIINRELHSDIIHENDMFICIKDINPQAKKHYLIIPKEYFQDLTEFILNSSDNYKLNLFSFIDDVVKKQNIQDYKLLTNNGRNAGQIIFHLHFHLLSDDE